MPVADTAQPVADPSGDGFRGGLAFHNVASISADGWNPGLRRSNDASRALQL
jgi:hypothetical protein